MEKLIKVDRLSKIYSKNEVESIGLKEISFEIAAGEFIVIMGPSGSGKSTLLNVMSTIDTPTTGEIIIDGKNIATLNEKETTNFRKNHFGFIFQNYNLLDTLTVKENIMLPLAASKIAKTTIIDLVEASAKKLNIVEILNKYPSQISGGQAQRVAVARALINNPKIILADEPTGALDSKAANDLLKILQELNLIDKKTILMVTHDAFAASYATRIIFIKDGKNFKEIVKNNKLQKVFYQEIIDELAKFDGEKNDSF